MSKKNTDPPAAGSNRVSSSELQEFVDRIERLNGRKSEISDDLKVVFAEAKSRGYSPQYIRAIVKLRKLTPSEREERDAMLDLYMSAAGMAKETPLFRSLNGMGVDTAAREAVIDALKLLAPEDGEITVKVGGGPRVRLWRDKDGVHVEDVPDMPPPSPKASSESEKSVSRPGSDAPDCTEDEAFDLGCEARRDDKPVIANPFSYDDKRRRRWDEGWRSEDGGDGMGPA